MRRYIIAALAGPALLFLGAVTIGRTRGDTAGLMLVRVHDKPQWWPKSIPCPSNLALGAAGAGMLAAYLAKGSGLPVVS